MVPHELEATEGRHEDRQLQYMNQAEFCTVDHLARFAPDDKLSEAQGNVRCRMIGAFIRQHFMCGYSDTQCQVDMCFPYLHYSPLIMNSAIPFPKFIAENLYKLMYNNSSV